MGEQVYKTKTAAPQPQVGQPTPRPVALTRPTGPPIDADLEARAKNDSTSVLRGMMGSALLEQDSYRARYRGLTTPVPTVGPLFVASLRFMQVSPQTRQHLLLAAIEHADLPDWVRVDIANAAVAQKKYDAAKAKKLIKAIQAKPDQVADFGKAVVSRGVDTVVGLLKLARFALWDNSTIRIMVDFDGYQKQRFEIAQTAQAIMQHPELLWAALTQEYKDAWAKGERGKALGYLTFDVGTLFIGAEGAVKAAASTAEKMKVVIAVSKDAAGKVVSKVTEVGDGISRGMAGGLEPALATTSPARVPTPAEPPTASMAAHNSRPANPASGAPVAGRAAAAPVPTLADPATLSGLPQKLNLAQRCSNWADVAPKIGTPAGPGNLPPGYEYAKIPLQGGGYDEFAYLPSKKSGAVPKLKKDMAGNWQPDGLRWVKDRNGRYGISRDFRLAQHTEYSKASPVPAGFPGAINIHHLTPDNVMRASDLFQELFRRGLLSPDRASNMLNLAVNKTVLQQLRQAGISMSDVTHYTSHSKYDALVRQELTEMLEQWRSTNPPKLPDDLTTADSAIMLKFADEFDNHMRLAFFQNMQMLKKVLRSNGSLGALPETGGEQG